MQYLSIRIVNIMQYISSESNKRINLLYYFLITIK